MSQSRNRNQKTKKNGDTTIARESRLTISDIQSHHPPQLNRVNVTHSARLRFLVKATADSQDISFLNLCNTMLVATSAVAGSLLFQFVKLNKVEIWSATGQIGVALGIPNTISVSFPSLTSGSDGNNMIHSDTSMSVYPAHVQARPSPNSLASKWQNSTDTGIAFNFVAPANSVIDVTLSLKNQFGFGVAASTALVAATPGATYYRGLDGLAKAGTNFPVQMIAASAII
jgi:hypothetical protein